MAYDEKTQTLKKADGTIIDGVTPGRTVTPDMIRQTPVGKLIDAGLEGDQQQAAVEMFTGLMNMIAMLKDKNLVWEIAGGTLESTFSALKANSDTQYHDTIDFGTICAKTQAIVNVMSEVMLDRLKANDIARKEGRFDDVSYGLTRDDVLKIYDETHKAGLSVPCPVCYVFSHWMGVPSLLGQMSRFQHDYIVTGKDADGNAIHYGDADIVLDKDGYAIFDPAATQEAARDYINKMHSRYQNKEGVDARKAKINSEISKGEKRHLKLAADIEKFSGQLEHGNLNKRSRETAERKLAQARIDIEENAKNITKLDEELREVEAYNWITQSLMTEVDGEYVLDENFKVTPDEILMDMRRTGEFADRYDKNWAYRTSRGAGMGKSILPYSGATLGDIILGSQTRVASDDNPWLNAGKWNEGGKEYAKGRIDAARDRARRQNLIGGQRLQSTSDFRPEWGLDYVMAFLELQAAKSNAQMYTKVVEAVDLFASAGADVNLSIMGSGNGYHEATAEEIAKMTPEQIEASTIGDKVYVLDFSDVTGMKYKDARDKSTQYDNVQMILVGMNDVHIRLAMAGNDIDFIIPWHSSGNSKDVLSQLVSSVEETLETSSDYTNTQSDKFISRKERYIDEETGKRRTRTVDARTDEQKTMWDARIKILTGLAQKAVDTDNPAKGGLTDAEKQYVIGKNANPYLKSLYERFYLNEGDKCYHVALTSAQAKQIFPYEYWQTDVTKPGGTKDTADENGRRFIEYCQAMGVVPRFSGVWDAKNKTVKNGNFAGAVYDSTGKITGYDPNKMDKGYWKLLIDRKMYDLNGNYREQKTIDVSGIKIGDVEGEGEKAHLTNSMLPTKTSAKYGIPALERQAAEASEKVIRKPFDLNQSQKLYSSGFTEAELDDMLRQAGVDYKD
ncbi:MAG: hypothetical protein II704_08540, partial [Erysipelotrichaceae bacterium]|nr:hypothetical protein [Erysipelotrichaceae bacterium]